MDELAEAAQWVEYNDKDILFLEDDPADAIFVLASGNLQILSNSESGQEVHISTMEPGDLVGLILTKGAVHRECLHRRIKGS